MPMKVQPMKKQNNDGSNRILIVDDSENQRDMCRLYLESMGFRVSCAEDGMQGLHAARAIRPDLIMLDLRMPVMDGYRVLDHLRGDRELADIPVIVVTGESGADAQVKAMRLGAADFLKKPFSLRDLVNRIREQLTEVKSSEAKENRARV